MPRTVLLYDYQLLAKWLDIWPVTFKKQPTSAELDMVTARAACAVYCAFWASQGGDQTVQVPQGRRLVSYWLDMLKRIDKGQHRTRRFSQLDWDFLSARHHHIEFLWRSGNALRRPVVCVAQSNSTLQYYLADGNHTLLALALHAPKTPVMIARLLW